MQRKDRDMLLSKASKLVALTTLAALAVAASPEAQAQKGGKGRYVANRGAQLTSVQPGSPAADAGLETDDIIVSVNGTKITSTTHLVNALRGVGTARMTVINCRDGQYVDVTVYPRGGRIGVGVSIVELDTTYGGRRRP